MAAPKKVVVEEKPVVEAPKGMRPKDLASELNIDAKSLRGYLRKEFARPLEAKNTSWYLSDTQVKSAREHFAPKKTEEVKA